MVHDPIHLKEPKMGDSNVPTSRRQLGFRATMGTTKLMRHELNPRF